MNFYEDIVGGLEERQVRYLIVGGVAVVLHGFVRATADLDVMIALDSKNVDTFLTLMKEKGYRPKVPVALEDFKSEVKRATWKKEKGMRVFSLFHPQRSQELIDVFVDEPISFEDAYKRRVKLPLGKRQLSVACVEDLITLKKQAGRPQDLQDIEALKDIQKEP